MQTLHIYLEIPVMTLEIKVPHESSSDINVLKNAFVDEFRRIVYSSDLSPSRSVVNKDNSRSFLLGCRQFIKPAMLVPSFGGYTLVFSLRKQS